MQNEARMFGQPLPHLGVTVGSVVIEDQMQFPVLREFAIQAFEETKELLMAMRLVALTDHAPLGDLECRKKRGRSVAFVVVGESSTSAGLDR